MNAQGTNNPWIHEDEDETEATPQSGATAASATEPTLAAPAPSASATTTATPKVAADPVLPGVVLPLPKIEAPETDSEPEPEKDDNFPDSYKECLELLEEGKRFAKLGDKPTAEQIKNHRLYLRLLKHKAKLEQGLPVQAISSHSKYAFVGLHNAGLPDTKLRMLARTNPEVAGLLKERDTLRKENEKLTAELAAANELLAAHK